MSSRKTFYRSLFLRARDQIQVLDFLSAAIRFCKTCSFLRSRCLVEKSFKKCTEYLRKGVSCDLYFSSIIIKRVYNARVKMCKEVREARARLLRFEQQFKRLEDKKKDMMKTE